MNYSYYNNKIYYNTETEKYRYSKEENWEETENFSDTSANTSQVYYIEYIKTYWYYDSEDSQWKSTDKSYEAGLVGSIAGIQQTADNNAASIEMITSFEGDFGESLSGFVSKATAENAEITALLYIIEDSLSRQDVDWRESCWK
mgnify:CR=1 FL=1